MTTATSANSHLLVLTWPWAEDRQTPKTLIVQADGTIICDGAILVRYDDIGEEIQGWAEACAKARRGT